MAWILYGFGGTTGQHGPERGQPAHLWAASTSHFFVRARPGDKRPLGFLHGANLLSQPVACLALASTQIALTHEKYRNYYCYSNLFPRIKGHSRLALFQFFPITLSSGIMIIFQLDCNVVNEIFTMQIFRRGEP